MPLTETATKRKASKAPKIGKYIRYRRMELNITQNELGRRLNYDYGNFIAMLERGAAKFPFDSWLEYANALELKEEDRPKFLELLIRELFPSLLPYVDFKPSNARPFYVFDPIDKDVPQ